MARKSNGTKPAPSVAELQAKIDEHQREIDTLTVRRNDALARQVTLEAQRPELTRKAHVLGDGPAKAELRQLNAVIAEVVELAEALDVEIGKHRGLAEDLAVGLASAKQAAAAARAERLEAEQAAALRQWGQQAAAFQGTTLAVIGRWGAIEAARVQAGLPARNTRPFVRVMRAVLLSLLGRALEVEDYVSNAEQNDARVYVGLPPMSQYTGNGRRGVEVAEAVHA
jgi:hypothetical protein